MLLCEQSLEKRPLHRSYKKIDPERLRVYVTEHPDSYQEEIAEEFGCSVAAICLAMKRLKSTRKKDNRIPGAGRKKVAAYQAKIRAYPKEKNVYVDECGIDTYLYREYGYAARDQKVFSRISGRKYKRCGIVAAQMNGRILAPLQYDGTMNRSLFEFWFVSQLLPALEKGCVIVMDNASFLCKTRLVSAAHEAGIALIFLPPYSPELNPIEHF